MPSDDLVKFFIENTNKRFDDLEVKVDKLISLRWMLIGAASVMSVVVTVVIEVAKAIAGGR